MFYLFSEIWDLGDHCREQQRCLRELGLQGRREVDPRLLEPRLKRRKLDVGVEDGTIHLSCAFLRSLFPTDPELPKTRLLMWTRRKKLGQPEYTTIQEDKLFQSVVSVAGQKYSSTYWEKNKRWAEQGAAIVCLIHLGVLDKEHLVKNGCLL